jgi:hypothetical protein
VKQKLLIFAIAFAGALAGSNFTPLLSGTGKLIFPETSPSATLSASSGALTVAAGGVNQPLNLNPSGTGNVAINSNGSTANAAISFAQVSTGSQNWLLEDTASGNGFGVGKLLAYNLTGGALAWGCDSTGKCGFGTASPGYQVDSTGDINASGVFRKGGTAGVGTGSTITVCTSGACATSCTLIFNGGIRTGGTCP